MKESLHRTLTICSSASLLLLGANTSSRACGLNSSTITNLPAFANSGYQVFGMNPAGEVTGFFFIVGQHGPHALTYQQGTLTDLGTLGGPSSFGFAINASGQVAGEADVDSTGTSHAFLYSNGALADLGTLGGTYSSGSALNDNGQVVGESSLAGGAGPVAFSYANGAMTSMGTLGGTYSSAFDVNSSGIAIGESSLANGDIHAFMWKNGVMTDLGTLGSNYSSAIAINPSGVVVGESSGLDGNTHGFMYSLGVMTDVGTLGGTSSSAFGVNTNGQVIGNSTLSGDQASHGFFYDHGTLTDIGTLGGAGSANWGMNNLGQVVGNSDTSNGLPHAFLWSNGQIKDLNTFLPTNSGWELVSAQYINDSGRIAGYGNLNGISQWFIMDLAQANSSPVAYAGPNQTVDCQSQVALDGSGSKDPDGDALTYSWTLNGNLLGMAETLNASLPLGTNIVTLTVTDPCGATSSTNVTVTVLDTTPPTGSCPSAVTLFADANCQAAVPDLVSQVVATDNCTPSNALVITQSPAAGTLVGSGSYSITLTVADSSGNKSTCTVPLTVADKTAPTIVSSPSSLTVYTASNCQGSVPDVTSSVVATDNCTPANQLVITQNPKAGTLVGVGRLSLTISVVDLAGNSATVGIPVSVLDTNPPVIQSLSANPNVLNPPNHQLVPVTVSAVVSDNCNSQVKTKIISITSNEATAPGDIQITGDLTALLAATRNPSGGGRIYTITVQSTDTYSNSSVAVVTVSVPQGNGSGSTMTSLVRKK